MAPQSARLLRASARKDDHVIRLGGEEFLVICQNTDLRSSLEAAERLRRKVAAATIDAGRAHLHVSISIGVTSRESTMPDPDSMLAVADQALYAAKQGGRDRVCLNSGGSLICRSTG